MQFPGFIGGASEAASVRAAAQVCRNWYLDVVDAEGEPSRRLLTPTPGLSLFLTFPVGPVRELFAQDDRCFAVSGDRFYELYANGTSTERGTLERTGSPASICSNGTAGFQVLVVSGGAGYIFRLNTNAWDQISDADFPTGQAAMAQFSDGFFFVLRSGTRTFGISKLNDGTNWAALDLAQVSQGSDNLLSFLIEDRLLWLYGTKTSQPWYNSGNADFPFEPLPGVFLHEGIAGPWARTRGEDGVYWIGTSDQGGGVVRRAIGYTPVAVSTPAITKALQAGTLSDAEVFAYEEQQHPFIVITLPTQKKTWVFDGLTRKWHERGWWNVNTGRSEHIRARGHVYVWGKHLVGDRDNGKVYEQSLAFSDDASDRIHRVRRSPHLSHEHAYWFYNRFGLQVDVGLGKVVDPDTDPQIGLAWSDTGGDTWGPSTMISLGKLGAYETLVEWWALGASRNRVFEVQTSALVPVRVVDAFLDIVPGDR